MKHSHRVTAYRYQHQSVNIEGRPGIKNGAFTALTPEKSDYGVNGGGSVTHTNARTWFVELFGIMCRIMTAVDGC